MTDWLKKHIYFAPLILLFLIAFWWLVAIEHYADYRISVLEILSCVILDLDKEKCDKNLWEIQEETLSASIVEIEGKIYNCYSTFHNPSNPDLVPLKDFRSKEDLKSFTSAIAGCPMPLMQTKENLIEELEALKAAEAGMAVEKKIELIRKLNIIISDVEVPSITEKIMLSWFLITFGVILQLLTAGMITYGLYSLFIKPKIGYWTNKKLSIINDIKVIIEDTERWPRDEVARLFANGKSQEVDIWKRDFKNLHDMTIKSHEVQEKLDWKNISKMLFNVGKLCREESNCGLEMELKIKTLHKLARRCLWFETIGQVTALVLPGVIFFGCYYLVALITKHLIENVGDRLLLDYPWVIGGIILGWSGAGISHFAIQFFVRWWTERSTTELDDIFAAILTGPIAISVFATGFLLGSSRIPLHQIYVINKFWRFLTSEVLITIFSAVVITWFIVFLFNRIIMYVLEQFAKSTKQTYDDMFVKILQLFGTFIIIAGVGALLLTQFRTTVTEITGSDNILLPYVIFISVITAVLGYSTKEGVENFFGGLLLQVEPPFAIGDRLVLESGEITDVREIGMRSTILYNVMENTEISIPNKLVASQKITNISRPDLQLRIQISIYIPHNGYTLKRSQAVLLDIAYFETEVDQARVSRSEVSPYQHQLGRRSLEEYEESLKRTFPKVREVVSERIRGRGGVDSVDVFPTLTYELEEIIKLRRKYGEILEAEEDKINDAIEEAGLEKIYTSRIRRLLRDLVNGTKEKTGNLTSVELFQRLRLERRLDGEKFSAGLQFMICELVKSIKADIKANNDKWGFLGKFIGSDLEDGDLTSTIEKAKKESCELTSDQIDKLTKVLEKWYAFHNLQRYALLMEISNNFDLVEEFIAAIGDTHRDVRANIDDFISELEKEPDVHSKFMISEDGLTYVEISFRVFATHLERRFEVIHKLHKDIQRRFKQEGIKMISLLDK